MKWLEKMKNYFLNRHEGKVQVKLEETTQQLKEKKDKEIQLCVEKWEKTGYLNDTKDDYHKGQLAVILENQKLYQEIASESSGLGELGIKLVHQVYKDFLGFEMVSVQTMFGPLDNHFNYRFLIDKSKSPGDENCVRLVLEHQEIPAKTRKLKTYGEVNEESIPILAKCIREEIEREIFTDLKNNAGTIATFRKTEPTGEDLYIKLMEISGYIHRKTMMGHLGMWIVTTPELAKKIASFSHLVEKNKLNEDGICYWGLLNNVWKLIVDPLYPKNQMLIGKYAHYNAGYVYCPYVALSHTPVINDPNFCPRPGYLVRYGKRLDKFGSKYYAKVVIEE